MILETIDAEECAELLRSTKEHVEEMARGGDLPALKIGRAWLFVRADLVDYLAQKGREEAEARRSKRYPSSPTRLAERVKPRRQTPPVLPVPMRQ